jgi:ribosomal protein S18 acetylase RimI-like enzyme
VARSVGGGYRSPVGDILDSAGAMAVLDAGKAAFAAMLGGLPGASRHGERGLWWVDAGVPDSDLNGVYVAPDSGDDEEYAAAAAEAVTYFRRCGRPFHWEVGLRPEPLDAGAILRGNGLRHVEDEPGMWLDLGSVAGDPASVAGLDVRPVRDEDALRDWTRVWGSGAPPEVTARRFEVFRRLPYGPDRDLRMFVGYLGGTPVATCYLFLTGGVAALHHVVTDPRYRRRGIGAAMTDAAVRHARDAGCRIAVLTASPYGIGVYRRLGFRECGVVGTYEWRQEG